MNNKPSTVKQCHITKENETSQIMNLTQRERLLQTQFRIYKLIYDEIKNKLLKIKMYLQKKHV